MTTIPVCLSSSCCLYRRRRRRRPSILSFILLPVCLLILSRDIYLALPRPPYKLLCEPRYLFVAPAETLQPFFFSLLLPFSATLTNSFDFDFDASATSSPSSSSSCCCSCSSSSSSSSLLSSRRPLLYTACLSFSSSAACPSGPQRLDCRPRHNHRSFSLLPWSSTFALFFTTSFASFFPS